MRLVPLTEACRQLSLWRSAGNHVNNVAVNVSALQFSVGNFAQLVERTLEKTGLPPACLELELTETVLMQHIENSMKTLPAIRAYGVSLAIDDFGTGYSSLGYLKQFPIDTLKIDKSFIDEVETDAGSAEICSSIIRMARSLSLKVVAEGVENESQLSYLRANGCDLAQGYLLSRPLAAKDFSRLFRTNLNRPLFVAESDHSEPRTTVPEAARLSSQPTG